MNVNLDSTVSRRPDLVATAIDQDKVFLDVESGKYYGMNAIGSAIWDLLETPISVRDLCLLLKDRFDVSDQMCQEETVEFCQSLADSGSLVVEGA